MPLSRHEITPADAAKAVTPFSSLIKRMEVVSEAEAHEQHPIYIQCRRLSVAGAFCKDPHPPQRIISFQLGAISSHYRYVMGGNAKCIPKACDQGHHHHDHHVRGHKPRNMVAGKTNLGLE